jgi:hypothetical protein
MKHAGPEALDQLASLLEHLRGFASLVERKSGTFYLGSSAFLHFHEDPAGLFADAKLHGPEFERLPVNTTTEQAVLVELVRQAIARAAAAKGARRSPR